MLALEHRKLTRMSVSLLDLIGIAHDRALMLPRQAVVQVDAIIKRIRTLMNCDRSPQARRSRPTEDVKLLEQE